METRIFQLTAARLSWALMAAYMSLTWPFLVGTTVAGVLLLALSAGNPALGYAGIVCVCWPLTLPGRALVIATRLRKRVCVPMRWRIEGEFLWFEPETGVPARIGLKNVKRVAERAGYLIAWCPGLKMAVAPPEAFACASDRAAFVAALQAANRRSPT